MATRYNELYNFIRTLLGDTNSEARRYTDGILKQQIELFAMIEGEGTFSFTAGSDSFANDLTAQQKALVILSVAKSIVASQPDEFSYKTPVMAGRRKNAVRYFLSYLESKIDDVNGGAFYFFSESEIEVFVNSANRLIDQQAAAQE